MIAGDSYIRCNPTYFRSLCWHMFFCYRKTGVKNSQICSSEGIENNIHIVFTKNFIQILVTNWFWKSATVELVIFL